MRLFCWLVIWEGCFYEESKTREFYNRSSTFDACDFSGTDGSFVSEFFVHNRAWLTAAAYEAAVSGSMEGYSKNGKVYEKADIQGRMLGSIGLPVGENFSMQTSAGKSVQVTYRMEIPVGFLGLKWKVKAVGKAVPLRPVGWIRKVKSVRNAVEEVTQ